MSDLAPESSSVAAAGGRWRAVAVSAVLAVLILVCLSVLLPIFLYWRGEADELAHFKRAANLWRLKDSLTYFGSFNADPDNWEAREILSRGEEIRAHPGDANYLLDRAETFFNRCSWDLALKDIDRAIALKPGNVGLYSFRAGINRQRVPDDYNLALRDLNKAIQLAAPLKANRPQEAYLYYERAVLRHSCPARANALALDDINRAIALTPGIFSYCQLRWEIELEMGDAAAAARDAATMEKYRHIVR